MNSSLSTLHMNPDHEKIEKVQGNLARPAEPCKTNRRQTRTAQWGRNEKYI